MKYESKFDLGAIVAVKDNILSDPIRVVSVHFGVDRSICYQCRVATGSLIFFAEEELEDRPTKEA